MENNEFNSALSDFTREAACGGAVRHLADLGYTVDEIGRKLDYPLPNKVIGDMVWKYFVETGIILTNDPSGQQAPKKITYVREYGPYGRSYLRRNVEKLKRPAEKYCRVDFGRQIYKDREGFEKSLEVLEERDRRYILGLPWPLTPVWHAADERMTRIIKKLNSAEYTAGKK